MPTKYTAIKLPDSLTGAYSSTKSDLHENPETVIPGLSPINIFIGSNNVGKSRLLRELFKQRDLQFQAISDKDFNSELSDFKIKLANLIDDSGWHDFVFVNQSEIPLVLSKNELIPKLGEFNTSSHDLASFVKETLANKKFIEAATSARHNTASSRKIGEAEMLRKIKDIFSENESFFKKLEEFSSQLTNGDFIKYYIPTSRSLNSFSNFGDTNTFSNIENQNHELQADEKHIIFTGQDLYSRIQKMLLGTKKERGRIKEFEKYLSEEFFDFREVTIMPRLEIGRQDLFIGIEGETEEMPYYKLGDGIQALIILTFPFFEVEAGHFYIEEPEQHLHPGLQKKLLKAMGRHANHQFFITTHSNHLLDLTLESEKISLYTITLDSGSQDATKRIISLISFGDEMALRLLGASNTSVFLSNTTIWVEGVTDRMYIRKYLSLYQSTVNERITEDIDYSFVEYAGSNITHWSFLNKEESPINVDRLCGKSILICDKDDENKNIERKEELKKN